MRMPNQATGVGAGDAHEAEEQDDGDADGVRSASSRPACTGKLPERFQCGGHRSPRGPQRVRALSAWDGRLEEAEVRDHDGRDEDPQEKDELCLAS